VNPAICAKRVNCPKQVICTKRIAAGRHANPKSAVFIGARSARGSGRELFWGTSGLNDTGNVPFRGNIRNLHLRPKHKLAEPRRDRRRKLARHERENLVRARQHQPKYGNRTPLRVVQAGQHRVGRRQARDIVRHLALQKLDGIRALHAHDARVHEAGPASCNFYWLQHCFSMGFKWS
jgi:hypothetical protein